MEQLGLRGRLLGDCVGVQIYTADVSRGHVEVKVSRVHAHDEGARSAEHIGQRQRAQGDVGARPVEGEDHLNGRRRFHQCAVMQQYVINRINQERK